MNIKQHIEAGHYPRDDKGRALVPTNKAGVTAVISDTDAGHCPNPAILGWIDADDAINRRFAWWAFSGESFVGAPDLLPPPPRKVKVTATVRIEPDGVPDVVLGLQAGRAFPPPGTILTLTGEYEEPWNAR